MKLIIPSIGYWICLFLLGNTACLARDGAGPGEDVLFYCDLEFTASVQTNPNTIVIPFNFIGRLIAVVNR